MKSRATEIAQLKRDYAQGTEALGAILHRLNTLNETIQNNKDVAVCFVTECNEDCTRTWIKKMDPISVPFEYIRDIYMGEVTLTEQGMDWFTKEHKLSLIWNDLVMFSPANAGNILDMILWHYCLDK